MRTQYRSVVWPIAIVGMLVASGIARAEYIPWKYNWSRSPEKVFADDPTKGYIQLTDESLQNAEGSSDIVATNLKVFSTATSLDPAVWTNKGYTLTLFLLDVESGESGTLGFTGLLNGKATKASAKIRNTFTGLVTQSIVLGSTRFEVTISSYTPPGPPGAERTGAIGALAEVTVTNIAKTPEPSTLLLACVGVPLSSYFAWRRRKRQAAIA